MATARSANNIAAAGDGNGYGSGTVADTRTYVERLYGGFSLGMASPFSASTEN